MAMVAVAANAQEATMSVTPINDPQPPKCADVHYVDLKVPDGTPSVGLKGQKMISQCSLTGVNRSCYVIIDRLRAATPPTIYVQRGGTVMVKVINESPFEKLTLDRTAINSQIPVDTLQSIGPALAGVVGKFALVLAQAPPPVAVMAERMALPADTVAPTDPYQHILDEQKQLATDIMDATTLDASSPGYLKAALATLRLALVPPPSDTCDGNTQWLSASTNRGELLAQLKSVRNALVALMAVIPGTGKTRLETANVALLHIQLEIEMMGSAIDAQNKDAAAAIAAAKKSRDDEAAKPHPDATVLTRLNQQVIDLTRAALSAATVSQSETDTLKANQGELTDKLTKAKTLVSTVWKPVTEKLGALIAATSTIPAIQAPSGPGLSSFPSEDLPNIKDLLRSDKNDQQQVYTLNEVNVLADPVKVFLAAPAADQFNQMVTDSIVASAPTKVAVSTLTVQFVTQPIMELTSGVMVPLMPYRSYTMATTVSSSGSSTGTGTTTTSMNIQENKTYTIIPSVDVNFRLGDDHFKRNMRVGWFATAAVGYNPATSNVEFGVGPSVSFNSFTLSFLADIGRDTNLASGFTVNEPLPGTATAPGTTTVWSVKPAIGISIRLPFGKVVSGN
jgi:hypothetical protein